MNFWISNVFQRISVLGMGYVVISPMRIAGSFGRTCPVTMVNGSFL